MEQVILFILGMLIPALIGYVVGLQKGERKGYLIGCRETEAERLLDAEKIAKAEAK